MGEVYPLEQFFLLVKTYAAAALKSIGFCVVTNGAMRFSVCSSVWDYTFFILKEENPMKAMVCEMCGSNNLVKQEGTYVCQHCGTKYSTEEAKKLMVEIDNSEKLKNYYTLARRAKESNNAEDAEKYYDLIREENPDDWEANFFSGYYKALQCKVGEICYAAQAFTGCVHSSLVLIEENIQDDTERINAVKTVSDYMLQISKMLLATYSKHYSTNQFKSKEEKLAVNQQCTQIKKSYYMDLMEIFRDDKAVANGFVIPTFKEKIAEPGFIVSDDWQAIYRGFESYIQKYESEYHLPENKLLKDSQKKSGGCYVATAVYGSYDCPQVWTLRRYRDDTLAKTWHGRAFIHTYYAISPSLVKWLGNTDWFKNLWKPKLDRMVSNLNSEGVENTPYEDKIW